MHLPGRAGVIALLGSVVLGLAAGEAAAQAAPAPQDRPDLTGEWALDVKASDDVQAKVEAAAGPGYVKGSERAIRVLPTGNEKSEVERLELRDLLLGLIGSLDAMEITQSARDVKLARGDDVGIFYFDREHVRVGLHGRKLRCRTTWKGPQLVIDQSGDDKAHVIQLLTLLPEGKRLILAVRIEHARLREPLELKLVYDRSAAAKPFSRP
jgi:hypothetical protein